MYDFGWVSTFFAFMYFFLIFFFAIHVVMRRRPVGVSLAWLVLLFALPLVGMILYLILGSRFISRKRVSVYASGYQYHPRFQKNFNQLMQQYRTKIRQQDETRLYRFIEKSTHIPALSNNNLKLYTKNQDIIHYLIIDITNAKESIALQFYTWWPEGECTRILEVLLDAARRGVHCKVLVDAVGSRYFLQHEDADTLRKAGIVIEASLPVGPLRVFFERIDIRNHKKIIIIDGVIAWTGSYNLVDPTCFKQNKKVGEWVDAMVRIEGPSVFMLHAIFLWDWQLATNVKVNFDHMFSYQVRQYGHTNLHVLPSNPFQNRGRLHEALLTSIYESKEEIQITTPYFVPDEALLAALKSASMRGVSVSLILPKTTDSRVVRFASRAYYQTLLESGTKIYLYGRGLLHTKCVLVDNNVTLFGSVNMDMRSVWLNLELTLVIYDKVFATEHIVPMMESYKNCSMLLDLQAWRKRSFIRRLGENAAQLASPLL